MPDKITVSTFQLFQTFPNQESTRKYLEGRVCGRMGLSALSEREQENHGGRSR
jgi:hypothetical protein